MAESEIAIEDSVSNDQKVGRFFGEQIGGRFIDRKFEQAQSFDTTVHNSQVIENLRDHGFIIGMNHLIPDGALDQQSGLSPDAITVSLAVEQIINKKPYISNKSDDSWWSENEVYRRFQKSTQRFRQEFVKGMGNFVPVYKNPGTLNRDFLESSSQLLRDNNVIIMLPEGMWYEDFDADNKIYLGMAHIARRNRVPVIPTYIKGAHNWNAGQKVDIVFGEPITTQEKSKDQITAEWIHTMQNLQASLRRDYKDGQKI